MGEMPHRVPEDVVELSVTELRENLRDYLERVAFADDEFVVSRAGKPIAALISMNAYVVLRRMIAHAEDREDAVAATSARQSGEYIDLADVLKGTDGDGT
jgi:prevent-host-death family protein